MLFLGVLKGKASKIVCNGFVGIEFGEFSLANELIFSRGLLLDC